MIGLLHRRGGDMNLRCVGEVCGSVPPESE